MSEVHIVAVIYPQEGKGPRVKELLTEMAKDVHGKEDYTLRYLMTEQIDSENPDIIMIETYKSKDGAEKHTQTPHFKNLFGTMEKEGLMAKAPYIAQSRSQAGFDLDRNLL